MRERRLSHQRIALVTSNRHYYQVGDDLALLHALDHVGIEADLVPWTDPSFDWEGCDLVVLRSTWDYYQQRTAFIRWARHVAQCSVLLNPLPIVEWNTNKRYLHDLSLQGIPTIPTHWITPKQPQSDLRDVLAQRGWQQAVLKPAIAAESFGLSLVSTDTKESMQAGQTHLAQMRARGYPVMIQPFYPSVAQESGEHSLIAIAGQITHAVRRVCTLVPDILTQERCVPLEEDEVCLARAVLSRLPPLLYARVDLIRDETGHVRLSELELTEPRLFFAFNVKACEYLVTMLAEMLRTLGEEDLEDGEDDERTAVITALFPARQVDQQGKAQANKS
ncbi:ATP-grasp domain-containing protein [Ktedonospora formicarum]|uniref:ATP-grasp domain-containing protein n=1 Tax=Ktedonospora formicarum TaxID=2778364 RepID=A0A8J3I247_9CHLR|nr:hypothetical protein [Ktedonospora formicarum]GHO48647.1 hypothetical protein KSX_68100 [Ktedonospora formicarum]